MNASIMPKAFALALLLPSLAPGQTQTQAPRRSGLFGGARAAAPKPIAPQTPATAAPATATAPNAPEAAATPKSDPQVFKSGTVLPEPVRMEDLGPATIALPNEPLEPYLLTKDAGPFMVMAHTFRGPEATRYALALALELRKEHGLPAWVYQQKVQPNHSNIRDVPPTARDYVKQPQLTDPERVRLYDEAAVLVGNCKTVDESEKLLHQVKKIHPRCLDGIPSILPWRQGKGLGRALRCTNPYIPAQYLFPRKADPLILQMNAGPLSIFKCPGRYTIQVAEFTGRSSLNAKESPLAGDKSLRNSPLMTAAEDAQKVADALAADPEVVQTGYRPYVYHDRFSSKVTVGSFNSPDDPAAVALRQTLLKQSVTARVSQKSDFVLVPAPVLMDLNTLPQH